jgi:enamine deaminase RidA (YjgF/YER057c/UK114 family)
MTRDERLQQAAAHLHCPPDAEILPGGHYHPLVRDGQLLYISGQLPRLGTQIAIQGRVGADGMVTLAQARQAARISTLRGLLLLRRELGSLDQLRRVARLTVYMQCTPNFAQHGDVADAASDLLHDVLDEAGEHARTTVGVYQLPKNAVVQVDMVASALA